MNANATGTDPGTLSLRLLSLLEKVSRRARKEDVHRLRTTVRRLEVHLEAPPSKIAKALKKLRKRAGKARDLDVHLDLLKPELLTTNGRKEAFKAQKKLRSILQEKRDCQRSELRDIVEDYAPLLEAQLPELIEGRHEQALPMQAARQKASRARQSFLNKTKKIPENPQALHRLRIETKKLRYSLEPLQFCPQAAALVEKFKQVQDAIGEWHDWATLGQLAEDHLDSSDENEFVQALCARAGREYRKARRSAESARAWMMKPPAPNSAPGPKLVSTSKRILRKAG